MRRWGSGLLLLAACDACCQAPSGTESLVHCANATTPVSGGVARAARSEEKPLILVMQLATSNLWDSFCQYTAAVNAQWAKRMGHRYLLTGGEYLRSSDLWRGGNIRAVLQVMKQAAEARRPGRLDLSPGLMLLWWISLRMPWPGPSMNIDMLKRQRCF